MATEQNLEHVEQALARLPQQFRGKVNVEALVSAITGPVQTLENALWALLTERQIDTAIGQQLDDIGSLVGEDRQGRDDDDYRRFVRARIATGRSKGTIEDILTVAPLVIDDADATLTLQNSGTAHVLLQIDDVISDDEVIEILILFLRDVVSAGVRIIVEYTTVLAPAMFFWDTTNWDTGLLWSNAVD